MPVKQVVCPFCSARMKVRSYERECPIFVRKSGKKRIRIVVWTYEETKAVCPTCQKRSQRESARRDTPAKWMAWMKKNSGIYRSLFGRKPIAEAATVVFGG